MNVHDVWVFPETVRHRKSGEVLVAVFAVRDDVRVIAAQVGRTKADALEWLDYGRATRYTGPPTSSWAPP